MKANKKALYSILLICLVILAGVSSFFLYYFYKMRNDNLSFNKIDIQESSSMMYNVLTTESNFYDSYVDNKTYIVEDIKDIKTFFNYVATFSSDVSTNYSYIIEGKVIGNTKGTDDRVLERTLYKNNPEVKQTNGRILNITDSFNIDVPTYVATKDDFVKKYNIDVDSYIEYDVTITYSYDAKSINKSKVEKKEIAIVVPISDKTTIPKIPQPGTVKHSEYSDLTQQDKGTYLAICLELLGATLLFVLTSILVIKRMLDKTIMTKEDVEDLINRYKKIIVKLKNLPDFDNVDVLFVDNFEDLLDVCYVTDKPINYYEVIKDREVIFVIFNDFKAYVYNVSIRNEE